MFKKTVNLTEMSANRDLWAELSGKESIQVLHRGNDPKVVISQEYFFHLLAAARIAFPSDEAPTPMPSLDEMKAKLKEVSRKNREVLEKDTNGDNK